MAAVQRGSTQLGFKAGIVRADIAGYSISLYESTNALPPGYSMTLSAYANLDVGPTPYYIEIYDASTGGLLAYCASGSSCSTSVSESSATTHGFIAYIGSYSSSRPPGTVAATSGTVYCTWLSISLSASPQYLAPGGRSTLTASVNTNVGPTPYYIEIFDASSGANLAICASGSTCSGSEVESGPTVHGFAAYVSGYGTSNPPPSRQVSTSISVVWFGVSLAASQVAVPTGTATTLTASANADVGPSPYWISIFDQSSGRVALCASGSSCSVSVTQGASTIRYYVAYVGGSGTGNPPAPVQATSNSVQVAWLTVSLAANPTLLAPGGSSTLTASATQDVGSTPYYIEIFDHTTHTFLASCATGTTCSTSVTQSAAAVHGFIAYISSYGTGDPPPNPRTNSGTVSVTWWGVTLATSSSVVGSGATVTLTATGNFNVSGTPYWVEIFDQTASPNYLNACGVGSGTSTVCTATQSHAVGGTNQPKSTTDYFVAYLTSVFSTNYPPSGSLANSNVVNSTWSYEDCNHEGGIWMVSTQPATGPGNKGEIQNYDRTLAGCGPLNTIAWSTVGISPDSSLGTWVEVGWTLSYNVLGQHYRWWFTEWGINYTSQGRDSTAFTCTLGTYAWWKVENTGSDSWTGSVDCEDGNGFHSLQTYNNTGFTSGLGWSEVGRFGGTGTSMEDLHRNLQYKDSTGTWTNWPGMTCQNDIASNWYPLPLSANSWRPNQGTPTC